MWLEPEVRIHAPEVGRAWLNSQALTMRELRGRVVLVDFWDYTCINCLRTLPYVVAWHRRYRSRGLTVIGVHAPEFQFARTRENVERAAREQGLEYPIVLDNDYQIWQAYANRCWPAKYLIDRAGYVRYFHYGEGAYGETEQAIQTLLREIDPGIDLPALMESVRETDQSGASCLPVTPELYLGYERGRLGNESGYGRDQVKEYEAAAASISDVAYLAGPWYAGKESVEACPLAGRPSRLRLRYRAAEVNLVMSPPGPEGGHPAGPGEAVVHVSLEGHPISADEAGEDVRLADGEATVTVREPRMYRLLKSRSLQSGLLELSTSTPGLAAYAFTFVSCVV